MPLYTGLSRVTSLANRMLVSRVYRARPLNVPLPVATSTVLMVASSGQGGTLTGETAVLRAWVALPTVSKCGFAWGTSVSLRGNISPSRHLESRHDEKRKVKYESRAGREKRREREGRRERERESPAYASLELCY